VVGGSGRISVVVVRGGGIAVVAVIFGSSCIGTLAVT
jgi:hypothetical protein